jgi:hypothetical protein
MMGKEASMTYRGHVKNGQIALDEPAQLPEGVAVSVQLLEDAVHITKPRERKKPEKILPLRMPGGSLAEELVRDRR